LYDEIQRQGELGAARLRDKVPLGETKLTLPEQLMQYLTMPPEQRAMMSQMDPEHAATMQGEVLKEMGVAGLVLLPYLNAYSGAGGMGDAGLGEPMMGDEESYNGNFA